VEAGVEERGRQGGGGARGSTPEVDSAQVARGACSRGGAMVMEDGKREREGWGEGDVRLLG
jgi:hypothetical protein